MWIRLTEPYALFFPGRVETAGSVHSIGDPRGAQLLAAGIAEPAAEPLDDLASHRWEAKEPDVGLFCIHPVDTQLLSAEASALVAALSRTRRGRKAQ